MTRLREDQSGAFPVFEAVMVAILVFTAMLFFTSVQRPTVSQESLGINLGQLAADTLGILESKTFDDPHGPDKPELGLADWVNRSLASDEEVKRAVDEKVREQLPSGTRYVLRFENGIDSLHLLPPGDPPQPRAGRAAQSFVFPNWTAHANATLLPGMDLIRPGQPELEDFPGFDPEAWTTLRSPSNSTTGPDGSTWQDWWVANRAPEVEPGEGHRAPRMALYGTWAYTDGSGCTDADPCLFHVGQIDKTRSDRPVFGIQLVVWLGA